MNEAARWGTDAGGEGLIGVGSGGETMTTGIVVDAGAGDVGEVAGEVDAIGAGVGRGVGRRRGEGTDGVRGRGHVRDLGRVRVRGRDRDRRRVGGTVVAGETTRATAGENVVGVLGRGLARGLARGRREEAEADTVEEIDGRFHHRLVIATRRVS